MCTFTLLLQVSNDADLAIHTAAVALVLLFFGLWRFNLNYTMFEAENSSALFPDRIKFSNI